MMRIVAIAFVLVGALLVTAGTGHASTYFVDSDCGSDGSMTPTNQSTPWKSFVPVNDKVFLPGDVILLKAGGVWTGQLKPRGSGTASSPIRIDKYEVASGPCAGGTAKPIINGEGIHGYRPDANQAECDGGAVSLVNQHHWEIRNLEVTNQGPAGEQYVGIKVANCTGGLLEHIYITDNDVHSVNGIVTGFYGQNAGIAVTSRVSTTDPSHGPRSRWNDVRIERNAISEVDRIGIYVGPHWQLGSDDAQGWIHLPRSQNIEISNNIIDDAGADGILTFTASHTHVAYNVVSNSGHRLTGAPDNPTGYRNPNAAGIWSVVSDDTTVEYNEVFGQEGGGDGMAFDTDQGNTDHWTQYNYSHGNWGFHAVFETGGALAMNNIHVRYNLSYDDAAGCPGGSCRVFYFFCGLPDGTCSFPLGPDAMDINNNTVVDPPGGPGVDVFQSSADGLPPLYGAAHVYNNVFSIASEARFPLMPGGANLFENNQYFGYRAAAEPGTPTQVAESNKLRCDPRLVNPTSEPFGRTNVDGLRLLADSPALRSGVNAGATDMGSVDYWGNPIATGTPNRSADNGPGIGLLSAPKLALCASVTASSSYDTAPWHKTNAVDGQTAGLNNTFGYSSAPGLHPSSGTCSGASCAAPDFGCVEWLQIQFPAQRWFDQVVLYPRTDPSRPYVGAGFPIDLKLQVWNGAAWEDRFVGTGYGAVSSGQVISWGGRDWTDKLRVCATKLRQVGTDGFLLQLAEVEVYDTNLAIGSAVTGASTYELEGWGQAKLVDGRRSSVPGVSMGYTSQSHAGPAFTESVEVTLPSTKTFSKVVLYPRSDSPNAGGGFPVDFTIDAWNGSAFVPLVTRTGYPAPGAAAQAFTWGSSATTNKLRVRATRLGPVASQFYLQLAEIEVSQ